MACCQSQLWKSSSVNSGAFIHTDYRLGQPAGRRERARPYRLRSGVTARSRAVITSAVRHVCRTVTLQPPIQSFRKAYTGAKENQEPTISEVFRISSCRFLVPFGPITRTESGQFSERGGSLAAAR